MAFSGTIPLNFLLNCESPLFHERKYFRVDQNCFICYWQRHQRFQKLKSTNDTLKKWKKKRSFYTRDWILSPPESSAHHAQDRNPPSNSKWSANRGNRRTNVCTQADLLRSTAGSAYVSVTLSRAPSVDSNWEFGDDWWDQLAISLPTRFPTANKKRKWYVHLKNLIKNSINYHSRNQ